jgi:hypothetical protein
VRAHCAPCAAPLRVRQVHRPRVVHERDRAPGRPQDHPRAMGHSLPCCGQEQARPALVGRLPRVRDVAQAPGRGLLGRVPVLRRVRPRPPPSLCRVVCAGLTPAHSLNRNEDGTISFDELKDVFATNVGEDTIPFNFDWCGCSWQHSLPGSDVSQRLDTALPWQEERASRPRVYARLSWRCPHS